MTKQNIVVVGAGYAGVSATKFLAKKFKKDTDVTITLIDRHSYHTMMTELHEVAGGRVEPEAIQYDLQRLFSRKKKRKIGNRYCYWDRQRKQSCENFSRFLSI